MLLRTSLPVGFDSRSVDKRASRLWVFLEPPPLPLPPSLPPLPPPLPSSPPLIPVFSWGEGGGVLVLCDFSRDEFYMKLTGSHMMLTAMSLKESKQDPSKGMHTILYGMRWYEFKRDPYDFQKDNKRVNLISNRGVRWYEITRDSYDP